MKNFYKYYSVFFITFIMVSIFLGGYKAIVDATLDINNDKVMVKANDNQRKEAEEINNKNIKTTTKKEKNSKTVSNEVKNIDNEVKYIDNKDGNLHDEKQEINNFIDPNVEVNKVVSVFKVSKDQIANQYTSLEKLEFLSILKMKLNDKEYNTIENLLYSNEDDFHMLKKINEILKTNLNDKDYEKILKLASRVVNIELVKK